MTRVQHRASLHEDTVQGIASGEVGQVPKRTRKASQGPSEPPLDYHIKPPEEDSPLRQAVARIVSEGIYTKVRWIPDPKTGEVTTAIIR